MNDARLRSHGPTNRRIPRQEFENITAGFEPFRGFCVHQVGFVVLFLYIDHDPNQKSSIKRLPGRAVKAVD
jgi:hypothetical protein